MNTEPLPRIPLPAHELQIGRNLREWRAAKRLTRAAVAAALNATDEKLANYEDGRARLPWGIFVALWCLYNANPRFIATGLGATDYPFPLLQSLVPQAPAKARFSEVYAERLEQLFESIARDELPGHIKDLERFLALAKAGEVDVTAVRAVAETAHANHPFPKTVVIGCGPAGALTRRQKDELKAKASATDQPEKPNQK